MPINPSALQHVYAAANPDGHALVNHVFHLDKHPDDALATQYREGVLASPGVSSPVDAGPHAGPQAHFAALPTGARFGVTPYHQTMPLHLSHLIHYPLAGWSKMTTQSLFHAGGIGHLVEHSHVAEHPTETGDYEPLVVSHLHPQFLHHFDEQHLGHPQVLADAAKVGFMDFLTNNQSRHRYSLLLSRPNGGPSEHLLATGHEDSFQYKRPNRWQKQHTKFDHLLYYLLDSPGMASLAKLSQKHAHVHAPGAVDDAVNWWKEHGTNVRGALHANLEAIQNKKVREHIASNFHARATALDDFARAWPEHRSAEVFSPYRWLEPGQRERSGVPMVPVFIHHPEAT